MITKNISKLFSQKTTRVKSVDFHPVKPIFIIGLHDGKIQAWDYNSNACIYEFIDSSAVEKGSIRSIRFHPHGDFFVSCGDDKLIRMWDYTNRKLLKSFKGHSDFIRSVDFHPTKPWIITSSDDQTIKIWNFMTGKCLATATGHSHYVMAAKFLDETTIISGSLDNSIRIWDCKNLLGKNNKFIPDIFVKQIVQGHDRGINFIEIVYNDNETLIISGGDDKEVKIWEYRTELLERESIMAHQGCVTGATLYQNYIVSVGEDGFFCVFDLKSKKSQKYFIEGRFWAISGRNGLFVCGHDDGFELLEYSEPKLLAKSSKGCYYCKNSYFYFSDLNLERKVCKAEGNIISIHSIDKYLLIQYKNKFEVFEQNKKIFKHEGYGVLLYHNEILMAVKKDNNVIIKDVDNQIITTFDVLDGHLLFGNEDSFFISKNNMLAKYSKDGYLETINLGFLCEKIYISDSKDFYAFISKNKVSIYDKHSNLVNFENEIVNIRSGFFYEDCFVYTTTKHLKYIFSEQGVIISVDSAMYPFMYKDNLIYFFSGECIESIEVDFTEIMFKKLVINNDLDNLHNIIESGSLPGLSPLSFLIKKQKGDIALPYVKNKRQRFELCLSTGNLDECLQYCQEENDLSMYQRLSDVALENMNFEISEKCFLKLFEWYKLFLLYVCTNNLDKMASLVKICDEYTAKFIKLYLEDKKYFNYPDKKTSNISLQESLEKLEISDKFISKSLLSKIKYKKVDVFSTYEEGLEFVTKKKFIQALEKFKDCLYTIAENFVQNDNIELRKSLGAYIAGLTITLLRKREENEQKQIWYALYFSTLNLKPEHVQLAKKELVNVCLKNGNYLQAQIVAQKVCESSDSKNIKKALQLEDPHDKYEIPNGDFCFDLKNFCSFYKECKFCYVKNSTGDVCSLCGIGYLYE